MERAYRLIGYLRKYPEKWIKMDSSRPGEIPGEENHPFDKIKEMKEEYPDVKEDLDPKAPEPRGKEIYTTCFFDAALGTPETKGRGHTGIILFLLVKHPSLAYQGDRVQQREVPMGQSISRDANQ